jgi:DNA-binding SARP family transcriptional activator
MTPPAGAPRVRVLGPLEVGAAGGPLPLGPPKQKLVLALLLAHANETVPDTDLIDELWGEEPPASALANVRTYAANLRRLFAAHPQAPALSKVGSGYALTVDPHSYDLPAFRRLARQGREGAARGDWPAAESDLSAAAALWRGPVVADVPAGDRLAAWRNAVEGERQAALETHIEVLLALGAADGAATRACELLIADPLREHAHALLVRACYRTSGVAGALAAYDAARALLADQLGIEPGPELRRLRRAVLDRDPDLAGPQALTAAPAPRRDTPIGYAAAALPGEPAEFVGRKRELSLLDALDGPGPAPAVMVICGPGGIGKTALAVHWARRMRDRFPGGCRYLDLRGFSDRPAMALEVAVDLLLWSMEVAPETVPADLDRKLGLYRSVLERRPALVVLDNVHDAAQVRPLLTPPPAGVVLLTSRARLTGLVVRDAVREIELPTLAPDEALDMLQATARGDRERSRRLERIASLCGYLPLALRIVGCRLAKRPADLDLLAGQLASEEQRLAALEIDAEDAGVRAAFDLSYRDLAGPTAALLRLLGVPDALSLGEPAVAALVGAGDRADPAPQLDELVTANLVVRLPSGRVALHDLVRAYAREQSARLDPPAHRTAAVRRLVDWYLDGTDRASGLISPRMRPLAAEVVTPPARPVVLPDRAAAIAWMSLERTNIAMLVGSCLAHGWLRPAVLLAHGMFGYNQNQRRWSDWIEVDRAVLAAATAAGDRDGASKMLNGLAVAHKQRGDFDAARDHYLRALAESEAAADPIAVGAVHVNLGGLYNVQGDPRSAEHHLRSALLIAGYGDNPRYGQILWLNLGHLLFNAGRYDRAIGSLRRGLALTRSTADRHTAAYLYHGLGEVFFQTGRFAAAGHYARQALAHTVATGDPLRRAYALDLLGSVTAALALATPSTLESSPLEPSTSDTAPARKCWSEAAAICAELDHPLGAEIRDRSHDPAVPFADWFARERERRLRINRLP